MQIALPSAFQSKSKRKGLFPSIPRFIPENSFSQLSRYTLIFALNFLCGFLVCAVFLEVQEFRQNIAALHTEEGNKAQIMQEVSFWRSIVSEYPNYKDAYVKLAAIEYSVGQVGKAKEHAHMALLIDPNDLQAQKVAHLVTSK